MREVLQIVGVDGVSGRHDEPDLVIVEARGEDYLVRVADVDCAVRPLDRRRILRLTVPLTPGGSAWRMPSASIVRMGAGCFATGVTMANEALLRAKHTTKTRSVSG